MAATASKVWAFVKRWWGLIAAALLTIGAVLLARRVVIWLKWSRIGKVAGGGQQFQILPGEDHKVMVLTKDGWAMLTLPEGVLAKDVRAVKVTPAGEGVVEVRHEAHDRR